MITLLLTLQRTVLLGRLYNIGCFYKITYSILVFIISLWYCFEALGRTARGFKSIFSKTEKKNLYTRRQSSQEENLCTKTTKIGSKCKKNVKRTRVVHIIHKSVLKFKKQQDILSTCRFPVQVNELSKI